MASIVITVLALCLSCSLTLADSYKNPHFVSGHDAIVHLFEWKWSDIAKECETFLGPMGFGGVQISPVQENAVISPRPWWERYQPISYKLITRSGNESELRDMLQRCNKVGVRIYDDILLNHMCADQSMKKVYGTGGSLAYPESRNYTDVPYTKSDFHDLCTINDYNNPTEVRNCELAGLHDLNQSIENVREKMVNLMNRLIDYGFAGFRIDAAKHMWPEDLRIIYSRLNNLNIQHGFRNDARPYIYQEVIDYGGEAIKKTDYSNLAAVTEFSYGREVSNGVRGNNPLKWFGNIGEAWAMLPSNDALIFIDNHDTQREKDSLTHKQSKQYKMAVAFMLAYPYGNPKIMSSFAFDNFDQGPPADNQGNIISPEFKNDSSCGNGWICEHRWRQISNMVQFRNFVKDSKITEWWDNENNQIAFSRGDVGFIAINADGYDLKTTIHTQLPSGTYCDIISGNLKNGTCTGKTVNVDQNGYAYIEILLNDEDGVLAIHQKGTLFNTLN